MDKQITPTTLTLPNGVLSFVNYWSELSGAIQNPIQYFNQDFWISSSKIPYYCSFITTLNEDELEEKIQSIINNCRTARSVPANFQVNWKVVLWWWSPKFISLSCDRQAVDATNSLTKYVVDEFHKDKKEFTGEQDSIIQPIKSKLFDQDLWMNKKLDANDKMIKSFKFDDYRFLSNFFQSPISLDGLQWNSENFYQLKKFLPEQWDAIKAQLPWELGLDTFEKFASYMLQTEPRKAKKLWSRLSKHTRLDRDWMKIDYMILLVYLKFTQNADLKQKLLDTWNTYIVEWGVWDVFRWVNDEGTGTNYLGKILMLVRDILKYPNEHAWFPNITT